nr:MAG TPA: hypothetical protein [Caudoviricetes sp.]
MGFFFLPKSLINSKVELLLSKLCTTDIYPG